MNAPAHASPPPLGLRHDLLAGIAVFFVSVPLSLGVAHASGAPLLAGILTAIIGGVVTGALSGAHLAVSGPAAGLTAVTLWGMNELGSFDALLTAVVIAGLLQLALAWARGDLAARMMPSGVVGGMVAAIGLLLIVKQVPHMLGYDFEAFGVEEFSTTPLDVDEAYRDPHPDAERNSFTILLNAVRLFHPTALFIGLACFGFLIAWERAFPRLAQAIPGRLSVVFVGVALDALVRALFPDAALSASHMVQVPHLDGLRSFVDATTTPHFGALLRPITYYVALVIAVVASLETMITVDAIDRIDPLRRKTDTRRELLAQGIGNTLVGLVGGLPVTAVFVRSSVNIAAGARTKRSAVFAGLLMIVAMLFAEPLMNRVPLATLGAILVSVGLQLFSPRALWEMRHRNVAVAAPYFVTIAGVVLTNLLFGIIAGLACAVVFILAGMMRAENFSVEADGHLTRIRLGEDLTFFHKAKLEQALEAVPDGRVVYIDGSRSLFVDEDIIDAIERYRSRARTRGIAVVVGGIGRISSYTTEHRRSMDDEYARLIANNREWVRQKLEEDAEFFDRSSGGQSPHFLFIGCSDSRVPAETITKTQPGDLFVHRNIANIVSLSDVNMLSVLQFSVDVLNVSHIIVCGHYRCGGVKAALSHKSFGLIDNWITPIKLVVQQHANELAAINDPEAYERKVIELHVAEQVRNLLKTSVVQNALKKYGSPKVHGWVYDLKTGLINDLAIDVDPARELHPVFRFDK